MNNAAPHKIAILKTDDFDLWRAPDIFVSRLRVEFPNVDVVQSIDPRRDVEALRDADVMIGWSLRSDLLETATRLRWIYSTTAAVDQFMHPEFLARDITLCNAGPVHGHVVAEHAMAMIMALAKRLPSAIRYQERRKWAMESIWNERPRPRELRDSTVVVVGLGSIGGAVATMCAAMGMHVVGIRERPERGAGGAHEVLGYDGLNGAIPRADFVVLALPATAHTHRVIDAHRLALFKPGAYLVNVSRGSLVDESALVAALRAGHLAGAALDVFEREPLGRGSPLWKMPQVLITPHVAFLSEQTWDRHFELFATNMRRYLAGEPLCNVVEKGRGY